MTYPTFTREELIVSWFKRSQKHKAKSSSPFDQFISLWFAFNSWGTYLSQEARDRSMLDYVKEKTELPEIYRNLMKESPQFLENVKRLAQYRVFDMRPEHEGQSKSIANISDFGQLLDVIYQIRCNLFHGQKSEFDKHDRELVELALHILSMLFEPIARKFHNE